MRSRASATFRASLLAVIVLCGATGAAQDAATQVERPSLTRADAASALERIKADPNLGGERRIRALRWVRDEAESGQGWLEWLAGFFRWVGQTARILVWVSAALIAGLLAFALVRLLRSREAASPRQQPRPLPTHVRELDIRPESLPRDVGAEARRLWDAGDRRMALALLYRGLLSQLLHVHAAPVRHSSTEGDCLALSALHLPYDSGAYATTLIETWRRAVYGGEAVDTSVVHALCDGFARVLQRSAPAVTRPGHSSVVQP